MMFVRLRDKGTIFHDGTQNRKVTGAYPVEVKKTRKVTNAIRVGILEEVEEEEAKKLLAKQGRKLAKLKKQGGTPKTVSALKKALRESEQQREGLESDLAASEDNLKEANKELKLTKEELQKKEDAGSTDLPSAIAEATKSLKEEHAQALQAKDAAHNAKLKEVEADYGKKIENMKKEHAKQIEAKDAALAAANKK